MDLLCSDFTKVDPSESGKESILFLTNAFSKFSQVFITPNQKTLTVVKILVDKWFYMYGIPAWIHSDQVGVLTTKSWNTCMLCMV